MALPLCCGSGNQLARVFGTPANAKLKSLNPVSASYVYDASSNMTSGNGVTIGYTAWNMPGSISKNGVTTTFSYCRAGWGKCLIFGVRASGSADERGRFRRPIARSGRFQTYFLDPNVPRSESRLPLREVSGKIT